MGHEDGPLIPQVTIGAKRRFVGAAGLMTPCEKPLKSTILCQIDQSKDPAQGTHIGIAR